jgi:hypothetical protein
MAVTVTIHRSENAELKMVRGLPSPKLADAVFRHAAKSAPCDGTYDKTLVTLTFDKLHRITFRIDLVHPSRRPFEGVLREALTFLSFLSEIGDAEVQRQARIVRGFVVATEMFGTDEDPTSLWTDLMGSNIAAGDAHA